MRLNQGYSCDRTYEFSVISIDRWDIHLFANPIRYTVFDFCRQMAVWVVPVLQVEYPSRAIELNIVGRSPGIFSTSYRRPNTDPVLL